MDRRAKKFFRKNRILADALNDKKDVYATMAAYLFDCDYEDCLEHKDNQIYLPGKYRRQVAKTMLCAMYFSTKRKWHKQAFDMINKFKFIGEDKDTLFFRSE